MKTGLIKLGGYINAVGVSLKNVYSSTSYVSESGTTLNSLANGIVATKSIDDTVEYIHILNPPSGDVLYLPAPRDGKQFINGTILSNGHAVTISQNISGVTITKSVTDVWSSLDTVIRMEVSSATI
ncbi:hypothetical protein EHS13_30935 [Paenibacillus psychroresistens]|uniref:Uncharacterized protein n=1 Tax=Paenibacillus psychroresistens TaxID=1778678 RepID=A0A6B8RT99_9BACL|nr:hypothetical protein [Paenibacillus psychroresistens]QGQ98982.1 hypothetical protein EHS13_30935 [Paenibacillus psychroresistens]